MPKSSIQVQEFAQKKPYLVASVFSVAAALFAIYMVQARVCDIRRQELDKVKAQLAPLTASDLQLKTAKTERDKVVKDLDDFKTLADSRYFWIGLLDALHQVLLQAEAATKADLVDPRTGANADVGIWIETFRPVLPFGSPFEAEAEAAGANAAPIMMQGISGESRMNYRMMMMMQRYMRGAGGGGAGAMPAMPRSTVKMISPASNVISQISVTLRGVDRNRIRPTANAYLAYALQQALTNSPAFGGPITLGDMRNDMDTNTFSFDLTIPLKHPFKL